MVFEKKKIQTETLSEYLLAIRQNLNLSGVEVSKKTGIQPKFLAALEMGDFKTLPPDVYVYGFLKELSQLYAIGGEGLIEQYKKEKEIQKQISKQAQSSKKPWGNKYFQKVVLTPKILSLALGLLFVVLSVGYIVWQVTSINKQPSLQVFEPANEAVIQGSSAEVWGKTDPGMVVTVNDQNIFVDEQGKFETQLGLGPGPAEIVVTAKNHFDKVVSKIIDVTAQAGAATASATPLQLKVDFTGPVVLGFTIDDQSQQTLTFGQGDSKTFTAQKRILLSTSDGGATKVTLNGQVLGAMGRPKEALANIPFLPPQAKP